VNNWVTALAGQNLNMIHKKDFLDDLSYLKGFAQLLQSHIIGKANAVMDKLALLDLKLKQQKLIDVELVNIKNHPGNISSNLGNNLPWKERLEELVNNAASIHTEFDTSLQGVCGVIQKINLFVKNMERTYRDSRTIHQPAPETKYYPNDQTILENRPVFNALGPRAGKYNAKDPMMNGDKPFPHPKSKSKPSTKALSGKHAGHAQVEQKIIASILPIIRKVIRQQIRTASASAKNRKAIVSVLTPKQKANSPMKKSLKKAARIIANKASQILAHKLATSKVVANAQRVLKKARKAARKNPKAENSSVKKAVEHAVHQVHAAVNQKLDALPKLVKVAPKPIKKVQKTSTKINKKDVQKIVKKVIKNAVVRVQATKIAEKVKRAIQQAKSRLAAARKQGKTNSKKAVKKAVKKAEKKVQKKTAPKAGKKAAKKTGKKTSKKTGKKTGKKVAKKSE